jgi:hypothetical protein
LGGDLGASAVDASLIAGVPKLGRDLIGTNPAGIVFEKPGADFNLSGTCQSGLPFLQGDQDGLDSL